MTEQAFEMSLGELAAEAASSPQAAAVNISGLSLDSRQIRPGDAFLAFPGANDDGRRHIAESVAKGARAVFFESDELSEARFKDGLAMVPVRGLRERAGTIAAAFYRHPSGSLWLAGATGTNGKSTICHLIASASARLGFASGALGTLGLARYQSSGAPCFDGRQLANTTLDAVSMQREIASLAAGGCELAAIEVSSHGLDQGRLNGLEFDVAIFSNLSRDHLDYHGTMDAYFRSKRALFRSDFTAQAAVCCDDDYGRRLADQIRGELALIEVSAEGRAGGELTINAEPLKLDADTGNFVCAVDTSWGNGCLRINTPGGVHSSNALLALAALCAKGCEFQAALRALGDCVAPPGRFERIDEHGSELSVWVDYAHTPTALAQTLAALHRDMQLVAPRAALCCVFGCGGERDKGKRPLMGRVAVEGADRVVLTSDNPRSEHPEQIIEDVLAGLEAAAVKRGDIEICVARDEAIASAIAQAEPGDYVLIAGRGHEMYQEIAGQSLSCDDRALARAALRRRREKLRL